MNPVDGKSLSGMIALTVSPEKVTPLSGVIVADPINCTKLPPPGSNTATASKLTPAPTDGVRVVNNGVPAPRLMPMMYVVAVAGPAMVAVIWTRLPSWTALTEVMSNGPLAGPVCGPLNVGRMSPVGSTIVVAWAGCAASDNAVSPKAAAKAFAAGELGR